MTLNTSIRYLALCAALSLLVACSSKADRVRSGLEKGAEFARLTDWDKANVEVRNVLQIEPKNAQAFFISGQISEGKGEIQRAFGSYSKAVELKPDHLDAKIALARIYMLAGEVAKAEQTVAELLAIDASSLGARTIKSALLARNNDVSGAITLAKALVGEQKTAPVETSLLLAGLYAREGNRTAALATLDAALKDHPDNLSLLQVAAQVADSGLDAASNEQAIGYLRKSTLLAPKRIDLWNAWALHHVRNNELDQAEAVLRASMKAQPDDSQRTLALLEFLSSRRNPSLAEKEFVLAIADKPKDAVLRFGLANLYRTTNRADDVRRVLRETIEVGKDTPMGLAARNQLAADRLANGKVTEARALVDEVLTASPRDGMALVLRGRMLLAIGDARGAVIDLRAAARDQPGSLEVTGLLAQAHRKAGEPELAREVLADAVKFKPASAELRVLLAADMADAKDYAAASAAIDSAIKLAPRNFDAYDLKARLELARKNDAAAEQVYVSLKAQYPKEAIGPLKLGQFYSDQKKFDLALKEYDLASRLLPGAPGPMLSAIGVLIAQKRFDDAGARIDALMKSEPKNVLPYQLRGDLAVARGNLPLAEEAFQKMIAFAPTVTAGYQSLARVKTMRGHPPEAITVLEEAEKVLPDDLAIPAARAEWLARAGKSDEAITIYESLVKREPDSDAHANNLAYLLAENRGDKASLERALALTRNFKDSGNSGYLDSLGWVHYKLGQYAESAVVLERAVQISPTSPLLQLHLGMALHKSGNVARSQEFLKKAVDSKAALPNLEQARQLLAQR